MNFIIVRQGILHPINMNNQNKQLMSSLMYEFYFSVVNFNLKIVLLQFTLGHNHLHSQGQPRAPEIQMDNYNIYTYIKILM